MGRRRMRVAGMDDQRNPHGPKAAPGELWAMLGCRRRHARAHYMREVHAALLDHVALRQNPADTTTALRPIPGFSSERRAAIDGLKSPAYLILK